MDFHAAIDALLTQGSCNLLFVGDDQGWLQLSATRGLPVVGVEGPNEHVETLSGLGFDQGTHNPYRELRVHGPAGREVLIDLVEQALLAQGAIDPVVQLELDAGSPGDATALAAALSAGPLPADPGTCVLLTECWLYAPDVPPDPAGRAPLTLFTSTSKLKRSLGADTPWQGAPAAELYSEAFHHGVPVIVDPGPRSTRLDGLWLAWLLGLGGPPEAPIGQSRQPAKEAPPATEGATQLDLF
jgi:hypothetical protein